MLSCFRFVLVGFRTNDRSSSVFEVMEPQRNFMEEPYNLGEYKLTWILVLTFPALHIYFMYGSHVISGTPILYYKSLRTASTLLKIDNILNRPYGGTIIITHDYKHILYLYHIHDKPSSHNVACAL
jgi:hypothetical protein